MVHRCKLPQKAYSIRAPKTLAEKIVEETVGKYKIAKSKRFYELSEAVQLEIMQQMKKQCSKYVFGALYEETGGLLYSFSREKEWIKMNPLLVTYIKKHKVALNDQNYKAWGNYYANVALPGVRDSGYYQRLLKREFGNNTVLSLEVKDRKIKTTNPKTVSSTEKTEYNQTVAKKVRMVMEKYPDIGLYIAQVSDQANEDKDLVREVLDNSFWSKKDGSRYYYEEITDNDLITDAVLGEDEICENEEKEILMEVDEEKFKLLDDPEVLIRQLRMQQRDADIKFNTAEEVVHIDNSTEAKNQKRWDREEVVILVTEYFRTKELDEAQIVASQQSVSNFLRNREEMITGCPVDEVFRNFAGIRMQSSRIRCLDPETKYHGMQGTKLQKQIVQEYLNQPQKLKSEAEEIYKKYQR